MSTVGRRPDRYDSIGRSYRHTRREDPRLAARIHAALGHARTVVNVGAGTGSYEPRHLTVIAVEPSAVMIAQRPPGSAPVVRAVAEALPMRAGGADAAMALWSIHHWADPARGLAELRRVAGTIVVVAPSVRLNELWLSSEYFPAMARTRRPEIQPERIAEALGETTRIEPILVPRDCTDGFGEAFWARPEAYLDPMVRAGMSAFTLLTRPRPSRGCAAWPPTCGPGPGMPGTGTCAPWPSSTAATASSWPDRDAGSARPVRWLPRGPKGSGPRHSDSLEQRPPPHVPRRTSIAARNALSVMFALISPQPSAITAGIHPS